MQKIQYAAKPTNPFNPGSPVDPSDFVGRAQEIETFRQKLRQTKEASLASMAVAGGYGVGKTSFLHKCKNIAESEEALAVYFSLNELPKIDKETLARVLIERIRDKVSEEVILKKISEKVSQMLQRITIRTDSGVGIGLGLANQSSCPNLQSALSAAWNALKGPKKAIVFLIDEAGVLEKNRAELMLYLRAVLEQLQVEKVPVMFIPAGKLSITGPSGTGFSPLVRTFPPAFLVNFSKEECNAFIDKKLFQVGMGAEPGALGHIYDVTAGHPYVLTAYMNSAYSKLDEGEKLLTKAHFLATDVDFVQITLAPFFARFYDEAGKGNKAILARMAKTQDGEITLNELTQALKKSNNQLSPFLAKLVQDGAIVRVDRGRYKFFHHLLAEYINGKATLAK